MMEINAINTFIGVISSVVTIESRIREVIDKKNNEAVESMGERIIESIRLDEYTMEKIDDEITKQHDIFMKSTCGSIFTDSNKQQFIDNFFKNNNDLFMYKKDIVDVINKYFDLLEERVVKVCSEGEKVIIAKENKIQADITGIGEDVKEIQQSLLENKEKESKTLIYKSNQDANKCIRLLNHIASLISDNENVCIILQPIKEDFLEADCFEHAVFKWQKLLALIDIREIGQSIENKKVGLKGLHNYIKQVAPDYVSSINFHYEKKLILIEKVINEYDDKSSNYYIALGALIEDDDISDEKVYLCICKTIMLYFTQIRDLLYEKWRDKESEILAQIAHDKMNEQLWKQIRFAISSVNRPWILYLLDNDGINDTDLANVFHVDIGKLRRNLYKATRSFLRYLYIDDYTTRLYINEQYREVLNAHLEEFDES